MLSPGSVAASHFVDKQSSINVIGVSPAIVTPRAAATALRWREGPQLGADQDDAEDQEGCPGQPYQGRWVLRNAQQAEMVEHQRAKHLADNNLGKHCRGAEARHHEAP